jgi:hypothetical protein
MSNTHRTNNIKLEETETRELTCAELENVLGGRKSASNGKDNSGVIYLKFDFKMVSVS